MEVLARRSEHGGPSTEVPALRATVALPGKALRARFAQHSSSSSLGFCVILRNQRFDMACIISYLLQLFSLFACSKRLGHLNQV